MLFGLASSVPVTGLTNFPNWLTKIKLGSQVLAELKGLLKGITWLLQKEGLVSGFTQRQPLAEQTPRWGHAELSVSWGHHWCPNAVTGAG